LEGGWSPTKNLPSEFTHGVFLTQIDEESPFNPLTPHEITVNFSVVQIGHFFVNISQCLEDKLGHTGIGQESLPNNSLVINLKLWLHISDIKNVVDL
jgi:hypothetical protein